MLSTSRTKGKKLFVCTCFDCQAFAKFLQKESSLDESGGTVILPSYPRDLKILAGEDHLRCVRLTYKGLFRWYSGCCRTPLANANPDTAYVGVLRSWMVMSDEEIESALGPVFARVDGNSIPFKIIPVITGFFFKGLLGRKKTPHPFFRENSWEPLSTPQVLTMAERERLRAIEKNDRSIEIAN